MRFKRFNKRSALVVVSWLCFACKFIPTSFHKKRGDIYVFK